MTYSGGSSKWVGRSIFDVSGDKIGEVRDVHTDKHSGSWAFVRVKTTLGHETVLPLRRGVHDIGQLQVPYSAHVVNDAPSVEGPYELSSDLRKSVTEYYKMYFGDLPGDPEVPYEPDEEPEKDAPAAGM
jgi:hypothetical protein